MKEKKRNYSLDLLRILACFMVIVLHVAAANWYSTPFNTFHFNVYNFYDSLVRAAVPLFVMISGVFFLKSEIIETKILYKKNILKLITFYLVWSFIYYLFEAIVYNQEFVLLSLISKLIIGHYHLWFIPMMIGLYIIAPLLSKITINSNEKLFKYFFIVFIVGCLFKTLSFCSFLPKYEFVELIVSTFPIDIICQFYSYFLLGYFLYNYDISDKLKKLFYILGILSVFVCTIGTWFLSRYNGINDCNLYTEFSIFTLFESIALFLWFKNTSFISEKIYSDKVSNLSKCTLGIYAIHVIVMNLLFKYNIINITDFNPILSVPIISVVIFGISLSCILLLKKIKFINKWLI